MHVVKRDPKAHLPEKVPVDTAKNVRNWIVRERKAGNLLDAAYTPNEPATRPPMPPKVPPFIVALVTEVNVLIHASRVGSDTLPLPVMLSFLFLRENLHYLSVFVVLVWRQLRSMAYQRVEVSRCSVRKEQAARYISC
jgi:hypothetical protein